MKSPIKLNHFLSLSGDVSRRKAIALIKSGQVCVNRQSISDPAYRVLPQTDKIWLKGKLLKWVQDPQKWYIAFNKPTKVLTSLSDPKGRVCVSDYFPKIRERLFPVGRLDWHSEGLLLMTNDGDFAHQVLIKKPPKTYLLKLNRPPSKAQLLQLKKGVRTDIGFLKALSVSFTRSRSRRWVRVILSEGKNRQLHRMCEKLGLHIRVLRRIAIGRLKLRSLKSGEYFFLSIQDKRKVLAYPDFHKRQNHPLPNKGRPCSPRKGQTRLV